MKKSTKGLRLAKSLVSNLNAIMAGGPPTPPGSNSCVQDVLCFTRWGMTGTDHTCDRTCS